MSMNKNQVQLAESFKQKAFKAWDFLKDLERQIEEQTELLKSVGVKFQVSGCTKSSGTESGFSQANISNSALHMMLEKVPHVTESIDRNIKRIFSADYRNKSSVFDDPSIFDKVEQELERLRIKEMREAIEWVKTARTPDGYSWKEKNYKVIPEVVRVMATPEVSKNTENWRWRFESRFDHIRTLELALYSLAGERLPKALLADNINATWNKEASTTGYNPEGINTFLFKSRFFELKAYRKAPDQITFTGEALALMNGVNMTEAIEVPEVIEKAPEPESIRADLSEAATDLETEEAAKEAISKEAIETQKSWLIHRANLRAEAEKKERIRIARKAQEVAISLHAAKAPDTALSVTCSFSEREGFMVSGDTKDIKDELGRQGLGLSWWARGKVWYIRGSKGKPWTERYAAIVKGLEAICKAHNIKLQEGTKLARAA